METLESLSDMLETTGDIQSIVRTMKSLSAVSIRQYEEAEAAISDYAETIDLGLTAVLHDRRTRGVRLPRTGPPSDAQEGLIVIGSDRGLCGRYNEIVARAAIDCIGDQTAVMAVIGTRAAARLDAEGHKVDRLFLLPSSVTGMTPTVDKVIVEIERWMRERGVEKARVVHNRRKGRSRAVATDRIVIPIPNETLQRLAAQPWPSRALPFFRMDGGRLLSWLVRQHLFVELYRALAEALASEHATRLAAMQSAERNIEERREDLTSAYRRKRQETITRELLDVVSGFEAVGGSDD